MKGAEKNTESALLIVTWDSTDTFPTSTVFSFLSTATLNTTSCNVASTHVEYSHHLPFKATHSIA